MPYNKNHINELMIQVALLKKSFMDTKNDEKLFLTNNYDSGLIKNIDEKKIRIIWEISHLLSSKNPRTNPALSSLIQDSKTLETLKAKLTKANTETLLDEGEIERELSKKTHALYRSLTAEKLYRLLKNIHSVQSEYKVPILNEIFWLAALSILEDDNLSKIKLLEKIVKSGIYRHYTQPKKFDKLTLMKEAYPKNTRNDRLEATKMNAISSLRKFTKNRHIKNRIIHPAYYQSVNTRSQAGFTSNQKNWTPTYSLNASQNTIIQRMFLHRELASSWGIGGEILVEGKHLKLDGSTKNERAKSLQMAIATSGLDKYPSVIMDEFVRSSQSVNFNLNQLSSVITNALVMLERFINYGNINTDAFTPRYYYTVIETPDKSLDHHIAMAVFSNLLYYCDRENGGFRIYKIERNMNTNLSRFKSTKAINDFLNTLGRPIHERRMKPQSSSNCSWVAMKSLFEMAVHTSALILLPQHPLHITNQVAHMASKLLSRDKRLHDLSEYFDHYSINFSKILNIDPSFCFELFAKLSKPRWRIDPDIRNYLGLIFELEPDLKKIRILYQSQLALNIPDVQSEVELVSKYKSKNLTLFKEKLLEASFLSLLRNIYSDSSLTQFKKLLEILKIYLKNNFDSEGLLSKYFQEKFIEYYKMTIQNPLHAEQIKSSETDVSKAKLIFKTFEDHINSLSMHASDRFSPLRIEENYDSDNENHAKPGDSIIPISPQKKPK